MLFAHAPNQYLGLLYQILVLVDTIDSAVSTCQPETRHAQCTCICVVQTAACFFIAHLLACSMETEQNKSITDRFCFQQDKQAHVDHNVFFIKKGISITMHGM